MLCSRCGNRIENPVDYCPVCGANVYLQQNTGEVDNLPETEVLQGDYQAFQDTVVEPGTSFFPPQPPAEQGATRAYAEAPGVSPVDTDDKTAAVKYETLNLNGYNPPGVDHVDTFGRTAGRRDSAEYVQVPVSSGAFMPRGSTERIQPQLVSSLPAPDGLAAKSGNQNRAFIIAIIAAATVAASALIVCLVFALGPRGERVDTGALGASANAASVVASESSSAVSQEEEKSALAASAESQSANASAKEEENADEGSTGGGGTTIALGGGGGTGTGGVIGHQPAPSSRLTETEVYEILTDAYKQAGSFDKSVANCATEFNSNYNVKDKSKRAGKESTTSNLRQQIKSAWDDLKDLTLPPLCHNTRAWEDLCECYECLYERIDVIEEAWTISLKYDNPSKYTSEILAPINAQKDSDGQDRYYMRFKKLYPSIDIIKP